MSASLVGSEMCIRDRRFAARPGPAAAPGSSFRAAAPMRSLRCIARSQAAVSYTHLTLPTICSV
eukprot:2632990-Alexandrium_andersonii.AAC.1